MSSPRYNQFKLAWLKESTFGVSAIAQATTPTYLPGVISEKLKLPSPKSSAKFGGIGVGTQEPVSQYKEPFELIGQMVVGVQNAVPLWWILGKSVTTGPVSGIYTHTITPLSNAGGPIGWNPSFTFHHEAAGVDVTTKTVQFVGCKFFGVLFGIAQFRSALAGPVLLAKTDFVARKPIVCAWDLDTDPALPATCNELPFKWGNTTVTWDKGGAGETVLAGLSRVMFQINYNLSPIITHWYDSGVWQGLYPYNFEEAAQKTYQLELAILPENYDLLDRLLEASSAKTVELKLVRTANEDEITVTLSKADVFDHSLTHPLPTDALEETCTLVAPNCSVTVKDKLPGAVYGE
jgi:hypothetical protein